MSPSDGMGHERRRRQEQDDEYRREHGLGPNDRVPRVPLSPAFLLGCGCLVLIVLGVVTLALVLLTWSNGLP